MKKKQILFLFAASALFAACSSDEMPTNNGSNTDNGENTESTTTANAISVTTPEGLGMSIGVFEEESANTRAEDEAENVTSVTIDITPDLNILAEHFSGYEVKADDFYIRRNGKYLDVTHILNGSSYPENESVRVTIPTANAAGDYVNPLKVRIQGLEMLQYNPDYNDDYTFEVYLWIDRTTPKPDEGSGTEADLFTPAQKLQWVGYEEGDATLQSGVDITTNKSIEETCELYGKLNGQTIEMKDLNGYLVRYNIYRGISGYQDGVFDEDGIYIGYKTDDNGNYNGDGSELGNTPYIKVSVHVNLLQDDQGSSVTPVYPTAD